MMTGIRNQLARISRLPIAHRLTGGVPGRVWEDTRSWAESRGHETQTDAAFLQNITDADVTEQCSPARLNADDPDYYKWNRPWRNFGTFVLEAENLRYESLTDSVLTPDNCILYDLSRQWPDIPGQHALLSSIRLPQAVRLEGRTLLLSTRAAGANYFNWMTSLLPRLKLVRDAGYDLDHFDHILVNQSSAGFQIESLAKAGVPMDRLVSSNSRRIWQLKDAVVPSLPYQAGFVRRWAIQYMRELILDKPPAASDRNDLIYISRRDARLRKVLNETELLEMLVPMGFKVVTFSGKTIAQQAAIMSRARFVVAPHGAGLTNLMFCPDHIDVVELHAGNYYSSSFWWMSTRMGNRHAVLCSELDEEGNPYPEQAIRIRTDLLKAHIEKSLNDPVSNAWVA